MRLNALDYPTLQAALAAAEDGDCLYVPGVKTWHAPAGGFRIRAGIELIGDGPAHPGTPTGTTVVPAAAGDDVFVVEPTATIENLSIRGFKITSFVAKSRYAIKCTPASGKQVQTMCLERVVILNVLQRGVYLEGYSSTTGSIGYVSMSGVFASLSEGYGFYLERVDSARLERCGGGSNVTRGILCRYSGVALISVGFGDAPSQRERAECDIDSCHAAQIEASRFEAFGGSALVLDQCSGATLVAACLFQKVAVGGNGIVVYASKATVILPNTFERIAPLLIDASDPLAGSIHGLVVMPQYNNPQAPPGEPAIIGTMELPGWQGGNNGGLFAIPTIRRVPPNFADTMGGLTLPAGPEDPPSDLPGNLFYKSTGGRVRAFVGGSTPWRSVVTDQ